MVRFTIQVICAAFQRGYVRSSEPTATRSHRSRVQGYLRTKRTSAAACGVDLARPCSHFSKVRSLIRSLRAKTAREQRNLFRVSRINFESTLGSGAALTYRCGA